MLEALARGILLAGSPNQAITCLDLWLSHSLSPADRVQGLVWRGLALEKMGLAPEAAADYRTLLAIDPNHAEARFRLAEYQTRDEPREAFVQFQRLDRETPGRPEVQLGLARCHRQLGEHATALSIITQLLAARPNDLDVLTEAGTLALDRGKPAEAEPLLRKAITLSPYRLIANVQLLQCLQELGKADDAEVQRSKVKKIDEEIQKRIDAMTRKP